MTAVVRAEDKPAPPPSATTPKYAETVVKRATPIVADLKLNDPAKATRVQKIIEAHYIGIHDVHVERDNAVKAAGSDKDAAEKAKRKAEPAVKVVHEQFVKDLSAELTPEQVESVKDGMTYKVVPITYKAFQAMIPNLTEPQKAKILETLKEAREVALDAGSSAAKHAVFGKFKGKINNYLSKEGYDLKKEGEAWAERRKKDEDTKRSDDTPKQPK
jgi:hypothetical protein